MKKILIGLCMIFLFQSFVQAENSDKILATVNGQNIMASEFTNNLANEAAVLPEQQRTQPVLKELAGRLLEQRIEQMLLSQEANRLNVQVSKTEITEAVNQIKKRFKNEMEFNNELKTKNLTKKDFERQIKDELLSVKYMGDEIKARVSRPSEVDVRAFFDNVVAKMKGSSLDIPAHQEELVSLVAKNLQREFFEQVKIRQIFIKEPENATKQQKKEISIKTKELQKELSLRDMNFAELSAKYSDDPALKQKKGDLGYVLRGDITPEVEKVVFSLNVGDYNKKPIKTESGYHFFRVEEKKANMPFTFDDVKADLSELLYKQNIKDEYNKLILELKAKSDIKINEF